MTLEYDIHQSPRIIELLSCHWGKVSSHLQFTSRLQEYKFHMQEVCLSFSSFSFCIIVIFQGVFSFLFCIIVIFQGFFSFQPKSLEECFTLDKAFISRLFVFRNVLSHCKFLFLFVRFYDVNLLGCDFS